MRRKARIFLKKLFGQNYIKPKKRQRQTLRGKLKASSVAQSR
jgi:hypothetical protein